MAATRKIVLLIGGERAERRLRASILRFVGFRAMEARDAEAGVRRARCERPDLILLDIAPTDLGWRALRRLRADPATASVPVAVLTDFPLGEADARALDVCAHLEKPFRPFRLIQEVERCLGSPDESLARGAEARETPDALAPPDLPLRATR